MPKYIAVLLDVKRMAAIKGSGLESKIETLFGGALNCFSLEVSDDVTAKILHEFHTARTDSRGYITDQPIAFNRTVFDEIAKRKSLGPEVMEGVMARMAEIKAAAAKESEYLPPPAL